MSVIYGLFGPASNAPPSADDEPEPMPDEWIIAADTAFLVENAELVESAVKLVDATYEHLFGAVRCIADHQVLRVQREQLSNKSLEALCDIGSSTDMGRYQVQPEFLKALKVQFEATLARARRYLAHYEQVTGEAD